MAPNLISEGIQQLDLELSTCRESYHPNSNSQIRQDVILDRMLYMCHHNTCAIIITIIIS